MASVESMWMHFQGQMSTQPSHMMHSAWSMCRNCLGLTAWVSHFGSTSCNTYDVENSGIGGFASVLAITLCRLRCSRGYPAPAPRPHPPPLKARFAHLLECCRVRRVSC